MKLSHNSVSHWIALALLIVACIFITGASQVSMGSAQKPGPGVTPLIFAGILAICSVFTLLGRSADAEPLPTGDGARTVFLIAVLALCYPFGLRWLGFLLSTSIMVGSTAYVLKTRPFHAALLAVVSVGVSYVVFALLLGVPLPDGLLSF